MDDRERDLLLVACREAYRCLRDRNRPRIMVEGRLIYSDSELANTMRHFAKRLALLQAERDTLLREIQPLWEAQIGGVFDRLVEAVEGLQAAEAGGWAEPPRPAPPLYTGDLHVLRALAAPAEKEQPVV